ncbi:BOS complex subunit TMEM147-like [Oscarella lobularis]|uniref:BOS complex subunit TMEM147-like n=1 Tax=Oscarella lobularis TaxID=121494 RepID=UPI003313D4BF
MTLYHLGNCLALACGPYLLTYKYSILSEYSSFWRCIKVGAAYLATQLLKMLLLATFFPVDSTSVKFDAWAEFLKATVDLGDLVGVYLILLKISGKGDLKILTTGLGWAAAELVATKTIALWVGARGTEFTWEYMQMSFDANISLVHHLTIAALLWQWGRSETGKKTLLCVLILITSYRQYLFRLALVFFPAMIGSWLALGIKALVTLGLSSVALMLYNSSS